jgi:hypothetical protein
VRRDPGIEPAEPEGRQPRTGVDSSAAVSNQVLAEPGKQLVQLAQAGGHQRVRVLTLRNTAPGFRSIGQHIRSRTTTLENRSLSTRAAARPAIPAPMTTTLFCTAEPFLDCFCPKLGRTARGELTKTATPVARSGHRDRADTRMGVQKEWDLSSSVNAGGK